MILLFISPFSLPLFHPSLYSTIDTYSLTLIRFLLLFPLIQLPTLIAPTPVRNHHLSVLHLTFPAIYYFPHLPDSTSLFFPSIYHLQPPIQLLSPFFFNITFIAYPTYNRSSCIYTHQPATPTTLLQDPPKPLPQHSVPLMTLSNPKDHLLYK